MIEVSGRNHGSYEVRELPYGKTCTWYPDHFVLECECGGLLFRTNSASVCWCGADHTELLEELEDTQTGEASSSWHSAAARPEGTLLSIGIERG